MHYFTVKTWFTHWLEERKLHVKPSTHAFYRGAVNAFLSYIGDRASNKLHNLNRDQILAIDISFQMRYCLVVKKGKLGGV